MSDTVQAARAARADLARRVLQFWEPNMSASPTEAADMEALAAGDDPFAAASGIRHPRAESGEGEIAHPRAQSGPDEGPAAAVSLAYDRGWREAVAWCREQQARGLGPALWADRPPQ